MKNYEVEIRRFIADTFLFGDDFPLANDESLLDAGYIDSMGILELISHLEAHYHILVNDDELVPENLDTIDNLCAFLSRKID